MNIHQDFKLEKQMLIEHGWMFNEIKNKKTERGECIERKIM